MCVQIGRVYAAYRADNASFLAWYSQEDWTLIHVLDSPCQGAQNQSIHATSYQLSVACISSDEIYIISLLDLTEIAQLGSHGSGHISNFRRPMLSGGDVDGRILVADDLNHRLKLYSGGAWYGLDLHPQPKCPACALYYDNTIYVVAWIRKNWKIVQKYNIQ